MASHETRIERPDAAHKLLLAADTRITCPKCDNTFGLEEGFARAALEQFEHNTERALEAVRKAERSEAAKNAQQVASQQGTALRSENDELRRLLKEQGDQHAQALKEVATLAQQSQASQLEALRAEVASRQQQIDGFTRRESALATREGALRTRLRMQPGSRLRFS